MSAKNIQVIGAGFPRTGTTTLKRVLETLGYDKCYHMKEFLVNPDHLKYWKEVDEKESTNWEELFRGYKACVDVPGYPYYQILMKQYPGAKVILTIRPFDQWYSSASETVLKAGPQTILEKLSMLLKLPFNPRLRKVIKAIQFFERIFWDEQFNNKFTDKEYAKEIYESHIEQVKNTVPEQSLLVYDVRQGWEPLCGFLNKSIPDEEFPHLNKKENFKDMLSELMKGNTV